MNRLEAARAGLLSARATRDRLIAARAYNNAHCLDNSSIDIRLFTIDNLIMRLSVETRLLDVD